MKISGIYKIQSIIKPERCYIGSAVNISKRWNYHLSDLRKNKHANNKLQNHFNKYGESDLQFSILIGCDKNNLLPNEQFFIDSYKPWFNINKTAGSNLGMHVSDKTKQKLREINTGKKQSNETIEKRRKSTTGLKRSKEWCLKISKVHKGKITSDETKHKMSIAKKGKPTWNKGLKLAPFSDEHKNKISKSLQNKNPWNKGLKMSPEFRKNTSEAHKGINTWMKGRKLPEETKAKMRISQNKRYEAKRLLMQVNIN